MTKPTAALSWEKRLQALTNAYVRQLNQIYELAIQEATALAQTLPVDPTQPFQFSDYPQTTARISQLMQDMATRLTMVIQNGQQTGWLLSAQKNDALIESILPTAQLPASSQYMNRNLEALSAFQARKKAGLKLSDRVWQYTNQFKKEIELGLDVNLGEGKSAAQISRALRTYLNDPNRLFRRVADKHGRLALSKAAANYHPGQGVYRSSYKNALRLARTEINMAYRAADYERWQQLDFVVGFEVKLSPSHVIVDICDDLKGRYPKTFKFTGWHPQCRCYTVPVLATAEELSKLNQMLLRDEDTSGFSSVNQITQVPAGFIDWVHDNRHRLDKAASKPYFISDNPTFIPPPKPRSVYQDIQTAGFMIRGSEAEFNKAYANLINGFDVVALNTKLTDLFTAQQLTITERTITNWDPQRLTLHIEGRDAQQNPFYLTRSFFRDAAGSYAGKSVVEHDLFLLPNNLQGGGLSKKVFQALYEQYQQGGIEQIRVHANIDVGGYAWARYGFGFRDQADRRMIYSRAVQKLTASEMAGFKPFWEAIKDEAVFPMQAVAKSPWGKKILLGSDWYGLIELTDPLQRKLFEDYLFGR